jgi:hypothetical protein
VPSEHIVIAITALRGQQSGYNPELPGSGRWWLLRMNCFTPISIRVGHFWERGKKETLLWVRPSSIYDLGGARECKAQIMINTFLFFLGIVGLHKVDGLFLVFVGNFLDQQPGRQEGKGDRVRASSSGPS